ncbi:30S ribosomal protein S3 [Candidatus Altiarchaeales archaeon WOR_SM1_SCG]|nr:30S ribosomal protein S3 [Candidatus Altiarchaeales archaeon WOR_SM1_SCG]
MAMEKHFIQEGKIRSKIESFLRNELDRIGYSSIDIQKTPLSTQITLYVEKPPLVIGKRGSRIEKLTNILKYKFGLESPAIDVQRVQNSRLDSHLVARRIAMALERGMNRRKVAYGALRGVMMSGARGCEVVLAGKLMGKGGRSRVEKYSDGYMKKAGDSAKLVSVGSTQAYLKAGVIGVTVKIVHADVIFPDQISVIQKTPVIEKIKPAVKKIEGEEVIEEKPGKKAKPKPGKRKKEREEVKVKKEEVKVKEPEFDKKLLEDLTIPVLSKIAKKARVVVTSGMNKREIINAVGESSKLTPKAFLEVLEKEKETPKIKKIKDELKIEQ